ncbi:MAG TPA: VOC family protein [Blastocatellia bacterium]|nr:VOC family protein [Blastocatellia bacterium]
MLTKEEVIYASRAVDHLLVGVSDLDSGIAWFEKVSGVRAAIGGSHPGAGTRNALVSLGARRYLELIAPDPQQTSYSFPIDVRHLATPQLVTWALGTADIKAREKAIREAGYQVLGPVDGSRARPDGTVLRWKTMRIANSAGSPGLQPIPFFIEWSSDSRHPSEDSPKGCELRSFRIEHPEASSIAQALERLGIEAEVRTATRPRLIAKVSTPKGDVEID